MVFSAVSWPSRRLLRQGGGQSYGHSSFSSSLASTLALPLAIRSGSQSLACCLRDRAGDRVDIPCSIDHDATLWLPRGNLEEAGPDPGMELARQALVARFRAPPRRRAPKAGLDRQVEDDGEVGPEVADGDFVELLED